MQRILSEMLFPVLLGDGKELFHAAKYYSKTLKTDCAVLSARPQRLLSFLYPVRVHRITEEETPFLCDELLEFAMDLDDRIPYLISCGKAAREFADRNRTRLETVYLLSDSITIPQGGSYASIR